MAQIPLLGGAYQARSLIAEAQVCINLFPELNPKGSPFPTTHYPTPGLVALGQPPIQGPGRGLYRATDGSLYGAVGGVLYSISSSWVFTKLGDLATFDGGTMVSMVDNGATLFACDGSPSGYQVDLMSQAFSPIVSDGWLGGVKAAYLDTFTVFNRPGTRQFFCTLSNEATFDPTFVASKTAYPDQLKALAILHREIWLIGELTTEVWYNAGGQFFPFAILPGAMIEHGTLAPYSVAQTDLNVYWLHRDREGHAMILKGSGYNAKRISTHAIEVAIAKYQHLEDAVGFCYNQEGHLFYQLNFPTGDATWVWDETTQLWHQRAWADGNGVLHRHRAQAFAFFNETAVVQDWQTGAIYELDLDTYTDAGAPIPRIRSFPHIVAESKRVKYKQFLAEMEPGTDGTAGDNPVVSLRWSDSRGKVYGQPVQQTLGAGGNYQTSIQWRNLGIARDRVFELSWSSPVKTALNGAYIDPQVLGT